MGDATNDRPISQAEMIEMFGEAMPIQAVNLVFNAPDSMTVAEVRRRLREIAAAKRTPPMTEIERLARAAFYAMKASGPIGFGGRPGEPKHAKRLATSVDLADWGEQRGRCEEIVVAILTALREPTEDMLNADSQSSLHGANTVPHYVAKAIWQSMIDHILEGK